MADRSPRVGRGVVATSAVWPRSPSRTLNGCRRLEPLGVGAVVGRGAPVHLGTPATPGRDGRRCASWRIGTTILSGVSDRFYLAVQQPRRSPGVPAATQLPTRSGFGIFSAWMTGKWCQPGVPHKGWICEDVEDLGAPTAVCEMCEVASIRYVHYLTHPDFGEQPLGVGCRCAENMEQHSVRPLERERNLRNSAARKRRWLSRNWRISASGNEFVNTDGMNIAVYQRNGTWSARITDRFSGDTRYSRRAYESEDAAKLKAFDAMIFLKNRGWGTPS